MSLTFNKIKYGSRFVEDFIDLTENNKITFPNTEEIAVIYGPNGTGKTSLVKALNNEQDVEIQFTFNGIDYQNGAGVFHIIADQYNRNIISGETRDFFLGDDIRHEFELAAQVENDRKDIISSIMTRIKSIYGISAANSSLIDLLANNELAAFVRDCANNKSRGGKYTTICSGGKCCASCFELFNSKNYKRGDFEKQV